MNKISKQTKNDIISVLNSPDVYIEHTNYDKYYDNATICYRVYTVKYKWFCDLTICPTRFGMTKYSLAIKDKRIDRLVRKNAIFYAPWTKRIMEIYRAIRLRHTIQQSQANIK